MMSLPQVRNVYLADFGLLVLLTSIVWLLVKLFERGSI
jgi:hypothetical protein